MQQKELIIRSTGSTCENIVPTIKQLLFFIELCTQDLNQGKLDACLVSSLKSTGSDRSNVVQLEDRLKNYPLSFEETTMWTNSHVKWIYFQDTPSITAKDLVINLATSGYYQ